MPKFGFSEAELARWRDQAHLLEGADNVGIVLVHGWSAMPKQVMHIARALNNEGYWVKIPVLKGHGTYPEDLEEAKYEHWLQDVSQAIEEMRQNPAIRYVIACGVSLGGNLVLLASFKSRVEGLILIGTPAYLRRHFFIWWAVQAGALLKKYVRKKYQKGVDVDFMENHSYQYFPLVSARESFRVIRKFIRALRKIQIPTLIFQISGDYMIGKRSPWLIYKGIKSEYKKISWMTSARKSHVPLAGELEDFMIDTIRFINDIKRDKK